MPTDDSVEFERSAWGGRRVRREWRLEADEHLQATTSVEGLAKLKPVFKDKGDGGGQLVTLE
jgi:acetyl-CoA acetyltransferase